MGKGMDEWIKNGIIGSIGAGIATTIGIQFFGMTANAPLLLPHEGGWSLVIWATIFGGITGIISGKLLEDM